jgi:hypothetical protein
MLIPTLLGKVMVACKLFLFDDIIVWAKEKKKGIFKYKGYFNMKVVRITDTNGKTSARI